MKRLGLTLVTALAVSVSVFANGNEPSNTEKWSGSINKSKLSKYLQLSEDQHAKVADICDFFEAQMEHANGAENKKEMMRNAIYGNLQLMKKTLNEKQYAEYERLMAMTLRNRGIEVEKK